jgi:NADH-quinone oxidoreductase subunit N
MLIDLPQGSELLSILPQLVVAALAMIVLLVDACAPKGNAGRAPATVSLIGLIVALVVTLGMGATDSQPVLGGMVISDRYTQFFNIVFLLTAIVAVLLSVEYLEREGISHGEYYALLLLTTVGMMIMAAATDLIAVFLGLEVLSISLYILAGYARERLASEEAAMKYFLLGAFASAFFLYGVALIYGATGAPSGPAGATSLEAIRDQITQRGLGPGDPLLMAGAALLIVGFCFKVAIVPFHLWTPDVYEGAPTTVTAFMSVGAKAAGFAAFLRVFLTALPVLAEQSAQVLAVLAALTMIVGNVVAISQRNLKRMLAYSSIAHAGYILVGLVAAVKGAAGGLPAVLFYTLGYMVMNLGAFGVIIAFRKRGEEVLEMDQYAGLGFRYPALGAAMTLFMISLAGLPPSVGFLGKLYLFSAALDAGYTWLVVIGVLTSVVSVYYYLRVTVMMYMSAPETEAEPTQVSPSSYLHLAVGLTALATLLLGLLPSGILDMATAAWQGLTQHVALR